MFEFYFLINFQISGLVTMADQSLRRSGGPSGEVESLLQKKDARELMKEMGSRVSYSKPVEESNKKKKFVVGFICKVVIGNQMKNLKRKGKFQMEMC